MRTTPDPHDGQVVNQPRTQVLLLKVRHMGHVLVGIASEDGDLECECYRFTIVFFLIGIDFIILVSFFLYLKSIFNMN